MRHTVLIATTEKVLANKIQLILGDKYNVLPITSTQQFVDAALAEEPILCIIDGAFRDINPYDICGTIKDEYKLDSTSFLLLGNKDQWNVSRAKLVMLNSFIEMPADPDVLSEEMNKLIKKTTKNRNAKAASDKVSANYKNPHSIKVDLEQLEIPDTNPIITSSNQYESQNSVSDSNSTNHISALNSDVDELNENVFIVGSTLDNSLDDSADLENEDIPLIVSPNVELMIELQEKEKKEENSAYVDPVSDFLGDTFNAEALQEEENVLDKNNSDEAKNTVENSIANVDESITDLINKRISKLLTPEEVERIVKESVDKKLTKALNIMSARIKKVIEEAVENELHNHLNSTIENAIDKNSIDVKKKE